MSEFDKHLLSATTLHPRKQKVEPIYICNQRKSDFYIRRFIEVQVPWENSSIFSVPWDLKLKATLITKPPDQSHLIRDSER